MKICIINNVIIIIMSIMTWLTLKIKLNVLFGKSFFLKMVLNEIKTTIIDKGSLYPRVCPFFLIRSVEKDPNLSPVVV